MADTSPLHTHGNLIQQLRPNTCPGILSPLIPVLCHISQRGQPDQVRGSVLRSQSGQAQTKTREVSVCTIFFLKLEFVQMAPKREPGLSSGTRKHSGNYCHRCMGQGCLWSQWLGRGSIISWPDPGVSVRCWPRMKQETRK